MGKYFSSHGWIFILLGLSFLRCAFTDHNSISRLNVENRLENNAVKSIHSEDGDIIDCVDIYKQPAFDQPALKDHIIQMAPSYEPNTEATEEKSKKPATSQLWRKTGSCPKGTIPIRRIKDKESITSYRRKKPTIRRNPVTHDTSYFLQTNHSKAMLLTVGLMYSGAKTLMRVYNPYVENDDEFSTSRVSLESGPYYNFESIECGWMVNPGLYGDRETRLHTYWTVDGSKKTGCFDLTCPGFVQTNNEIALGGAIRPISVEGQLPWEITIYIYKDLNTSNWWVQFGERINIGYWPAKLFRLLLGNAQTANWGGEVYSPRIGKIPHTRTAMGSGKLPDWTRGNSGFMKYIRIRDVSLNLRFPDWVETYTDEYRCYGVWYVGDYIVDPEFHFGGPGRNRMCP